MDDHRYDLWEYLADEFDVIALDGQIEEIIRLALKSSNEPDEGAKESMQSTNSK